VKLKIKIDYSLCSDPTDCLACIRACPLGVLFKAPINDPKDPGTPPKGYKIVPLYDKICNGCGECVKVCPKNAIKLS